LDDPPLKEKDIKRQKKRGGSGLINITKQHQILTGEREIIQD